MTTEITVQETNQRAEEVREEINKLKINLYEGMFTLAELLAEARANSYHLQYGFARFGTWIEEGSGLDMSERSCYYLINIITKAKELGIPREQLKLAKMSKLKEIFSLDLEEFGKEIKALVESSGNKSLQQIRDEVQEIKLGKGAETFVFMTMKVPKSVKEKIIDPAFEIIRRQYGDARDPKTGEILDITDTRCLEFVCASYLQDPNNEEDPSSGERLEIEGVGAGV